MRARLRAVATLLLAILISIPLAGPAAAQPVWATAGQAAIHPGVQTSTHGAGNCTSNFVFYDDTHVYLGQAAHCSIDGEAPAASSDVPLPAGCSTPSLPIGTPVDIEGATRPATLVYSSWITMQDVGETDLNTCSYNDFALIRLDPVDHRRVNPTMPYWGGPTGISTSITAGETVHSYGDSPLRLGLEELAPKEGVSRGQTMGGWNHTVLVLTPGLPGDSGSGFLDSRGRAFGVLSTVIVFPDVAHNGVGDLSRAIDYMRHHAGLDVTLATGTVPFSGGTPLSGLYPAANPLLDVLGLTTRLLQELI